MEVEVEVQVEVELQVAVTQRIKKNTFADSGIEVASAESVELTSARFLISRYS